MLATKAPLFSPKQFTLSNTCIVNIDGLGSMTLKVFETWHPLWMSVIIKL